MSAGWPRRGTVPRSAPRCRRPVAPTSSAPQRSGLDRFAVELDTGDGVGAGAVATPHKSTSTCPGRDAPTAPAAARGGTEQLADRRARRPRRHRCTPPRPPARAPARADEQGQHHYSMTRCDSSRLDGARGVRCGCLPVLPLADHAQPGPPVRTAPTVARHGSRVDRVDVTRRLVDELRTGTQARRGGRRVTRFRRRPCVDVVDVDHDSAAARLGRSAARAATGGPRELAPAVAGALADPRVGLGGVDRTTGAPGGGVVAEECEEPAVARRATVGRTTR